MGGQARQEGEGEEEGRTKKQQETVINTGSGQIFDRELEQKKKEYQELSKRIQNLHSRIDAAVEKEDFDMAEELETKYQNMLTTHEKIKTFLEKHNVNVLENQNTT